MLIFGHRGAVHPTAPENTLASVERALRQGADGVEIDVRVTADGVPVCHHDPTLQRTAEDARQVALTSYTELPWIGSHRVPRLSEVLDLVAGKGHVIVELKTPSWPAISDTVDAVTGVLRRHRLDEVTVSSFDRLRLSMIRAAGLPLETALLGRPSVSVAGLITQARADGHPQLHPHLSSMLIHPDAAELTHAAGLRVTPWTVDRPRDLEHLRAAGVHAVICDDPAAARSVVPRQLADAG